jgi:hypothetical protein
MARRYTKPKSKIVVEPFAGSAGFSTYWSPEVCHLVEINPRVVEIWKYLIHAHPTDIMSLPSSIDSLSDLVGLPSGAKFLILMWANKGCADIPKSLSPWYFNYRNSGDCSVWGKPVKDRISSQLTRIKGWTITLGNWSIAPTGKNIHMHVDPPFSCSAGRKYTFSEIDYTSLGEWCKTVDVDHIQVCESASADWLPFRAIGKSETTRGKRSRTKFNEACYERHR